MRAEDLSRTHWVVVGLLLGLVFSYVRLHIGQPDPSQTHSLANLEREFFRPPTHGTDNKDYPWVTNVLVYPPEPIPTDGATSSAPQNLVLVTFTVRTPVEKQWQWTPASIHVREPLSAPTRRVGGTDLTVRAYLDALGDETGKGRIYRYAWWAEPKWVYITWTAMSMLLVGGVWPLALSLLIGAGFGRRSDEKKPSLWQQWKAYRQDAARRARTSAAYPAAPKKPQTGSASLSSEEMDRLSAMEAELHDFLATGSSTADGADDTVNAAPAIRPLTAGPIEPPKADDQKKEDKSYGGTFYPTVAHGRQKRPEDNAAPKGE